VYLFYFDESGNTQMNAKSLAAFPWFALGAVGIHVHHVYNVYRQFRENDPTYPYFASRSAVEGIDQTAGKHRAPGYRELWIKLMIGGRRSASYGSPVRPLAHLKRL